MHGEIISKELGDIVSENVGCIVFDLGCRFPYANQKILKFSIGIKTNNGISDVIDTKLNHRYPNHDYVTLSKKYGRKLSQIGYPLPIDLGTQSIALYIRLGTAAQYDTHIYPIQLSLTEEKPVCALSLHVDFNSSVFKFYSLERSGNGWNRTMWTNDVNVETISGNDRVFTYTDSSSVMVENGYVIYPNVLITPIPQTIRDLAII